MEQEQSASAQDVLLVGYGSDSRRITNAFADRPVRFIVVEKDRKVAAEARAEGHSVVEGDASDWSILREARVEGVEVVAVTPAPLDEAIVMAIRRSRPVGVILTHLSHGYTDRETDATTRMISRMKSLLDLAGTPAS